MSSLRVYLNLDTLNDLPTTSLWPGLQGEEALAKLAEDGFEGVQVTDLRPRSSKLPYCGLDRINLPSEADEVLARHADLGDECVTLHVGWGIEDDDTCDRLVDAVLTASHKHGLPAYIETHRATITQDMYRTVRLVERNPDLRLNGDFSHYYCGQEMVYGGMDMKLDFMAPLFERVAFLHGRIAAPGFMQAPIGAPTGRPLLAQGDNNYLEDFRRMWTLAMRGFLRMASPSDPLVFAPEILPPLYYYARVFPGPDGTLIEESDRYAEALLYAKVARDCFHAAQNA